MLVLSRHVGGAIVIDHEIEIVVLRMSHGNVKLGITAPPGITVNRLEVEARMQRGKEEGDDGQHK